MGLVPDEVDRLILENRASPISKFPQVDLSRIRALLDRMRLANSKAEEASRKWEKQKAFLNDKYRGDDRLKKARAMEVNLALNDAMDSWNWWRREANRCAMAITAEYHAAILLGDL